MMDEGRQVLAADGVEELAVPFIEPHLSEHVGNRDDDRGNEDRHHASPALRAPQHPREQAQVARKIEILLRARPRLRPRRRAWLLRPG